MLSIIWSILKVIGIVILAVLGILLAILLLVLLVPFRYEAAARGHYGGADGLEEGMPADFLIKVRLSWLLRIITVRFQVSGTGAAGRVKLFGIPLVRIGGNKREKKPKKKKTKKEKASEEIPAAEASGKEDGGAVKPVLEKNSSEHEFSESCSSEKSEKEIRSQEPESAENGCFRFVHKGKQFFAGLVKKIREFFSGICSFFLNLREKLENGREKLERVWKFLSCEKNREVFRFLFKEAKRLFRHILPGKFSGKISFSLEDPASTGQALMLLGFFYPVLQDRMQITPLFENRTYIEGDLFIKGRIRVAALLIIVLKIWFDKGFRAFRKRGRKLKEELV